MRKVQLALAVIGAVLLLGPALAGCGGARTPGPGPSTSPLPNTSPGLVVPISVTRTGGIAGVRQTIAVAVDGTWVYTDAKTNQTSRGSLTLDQLSQLVRLVGEHRLIDQLRQHSSRGPACNDAFEYTITFGTQDTFYFSDCGRTPVPDVDAVLSELSRNTPF